MTHLASAHVTAETDKKICAFLYELAVVPNPELPSEPLDTGSSGRWGLSAFWSCKFISRAPSEPRSSL